jgi:molecular chaperone DnaK (HSP70)
MANKVDKRAAKKAPKAESGEEKTAPKAFGKEMIMGIDLGTSKSAAAFLMGGYSE